MRTRGLGWFVVTSIMGFNCLLAQTTFLRKDIPIEAPFAVLAGDFNGDRRPDVLIRGIRGRWWMYEYYILLGGSEGHFGVPIRVEPSVIPWGANIVGVADFDCDGKDDLVTDEWVLVLSRGDGVFSPPVSIPYQARAVGDFNGDGKSDILGQEGVLLGNGDGSFQPVATAIPWGEVAVGDFNGDHRSDVAMAMWTTLPNMTSTVCVFLGQSDGRFSAAIRTQMESPLASSGGLSPPADYNGDGLPDLAARSGIMLSSGDGSFQWAPYPPGTVSFESADLIAAADVTGDGYADLVIGHHGTNSISVFPGRGDGTFLEPSEGLVGWGRYPRPGVAADLDGNGRLDLVTVNLESNSVSILINTTISGPELRRALSSASYTAIVAPESLATLFAPTGATTAASASPPWPTHLGGLSLEIRDGTGVKRLAPLLYVSPTQINFQVPAGISGSSEATLTIVDERGTTEAGSMQVDAVAPGLFMASHRNATPAATAVLVEPGGAQVPIPVVTCSSSPMGATDCESSPIAVSSATDRSIYLSFYGTGFRGANLDSVTCAINGVPVPVAYAGPQGTPGLDRIDVRLLPEVLDTFEGLAGKGRVTVQIDGVVANSAWIALR